MKISRITRGLYAYDCIDCDTIAQEDALRLWFESHVMVESEGPTDRSDETGNSAAVQPGSRDVRLEWDRVVLDLTGAEAVEFSGEYISSKADARIHWKMIECWTSSDRHYFMFEGWIV